MQPTCKLIKGKPPTIFYTTIRNIIYRIPSMRVEGFSGFKSRTYS